jgi:Barstar (barnase inhibitor)
LVIDGSRISDFPEFVREFSDLLLDFSWHGSLDALDDILRGGCGTPDGGFVLQWRFSGRSRIALGYDAKASWLQQTLTTCHESNRDSIRRQLADAKQGEGPTLFDDLVGLIRRHGPCGAEPDSAVDLELL